METIVVTGGAGFIGSHYVDLLVSNSVDGIVVIDALTYAGERAHLSTSLDSDSVTFVEKRVEAVADTDLLEDADTIVHFAAETHVDRSIHDSRAFARSNVLGTASILEAALSAEVEQVVLVSTDEVYGSAPPGTEYDEGDSLNPRNPYAASKAGADLMAKAFYETHGVNTVRVRPSNAFGPRQNHEKFIPTVILNALTGEEIPIYGDGQQVREWTFVGDLSRAIEIARLHGSAGEVYNIGSGVRCRNIDVCRTVVEVIERGKDLITHVGDRPGHDRRYALDSSKIRSLGWTPSTSFEEGIDASVDYYAKKT